MFEIIEDLYFFTATCNSWLTLIDSEVATDIIIGSLEYFTNSNYCNIYGFVIMPNHIHLLLGIKSENKIDFQQRFLRYTSQQILRKMKLHSDPMLSYIMSSQADRKYHFWERNPKWIAIIHSDIFWQKLSYIHNNPLQQKWKLSEKPEDYILSSAESYKSGISKFPFLKLWE